MKVCIVGTGYVGLVTGTCLAEMGNDVLCVDSDESKIERLRHGKVPIYEPGLEELVASNSLEGRLAFTTDLREAVRSSQICMVAVGTPPAAGGEADLSALWSVVRVIGESAEGYKLVVIKSTVPVGTCARVARVLKESGRDLSVVSNPEFLKQGDAVRDFLKPDRVIIGADDPRADALMRELYSPFLRTGNPIITMDLPSAEMTKYAANAFLATKISFINEISQICEAVGADVESVRFGITSDSRIGSQFLFPGLGFGGSCFPKDLRALQATATEHGAPSKLLQAVEEVNETQRLRFVQRVESYFGGRLSGVKLALWGLTFKPRTDDLREAPALTIAEALLGRGASISCFDPKGMENARQILGDRVSYRSSAYEALEDCEALMICTEWNEFRRPDFEKVRQLLKRPVIFDGRNLYDPQRMQERGFTYLPIGRSVRLAPTAVPQ